MDKNTLTQKRIKSNKFWLIFTFCFTALSDISVFASLMIGQFGVEHFIFPLVLLAVDALLLFGIITSDFRFRYSMVIPIVYFIVSIAISGFVAAWYFVVQKVVIMTSTAMAFWVGSHVLAVVALAFGVSNAAKKGGAMKTITGILSLCAMLFSLVYVFTVCMTGYFGQGEMDGSGYYVYAERTLEYEEMDDGSYKVVGALAGKGGRVVVPSEFNNGKVAAISCELFNDETVDSVVINCDPDVDFDDVGALLKRRGEIEISAPFENVDKIRGKIFNAVANGAYNGPLSSSSLDASVISFANAICPVEENDKVFVQFNYDKDSLDIVKGKYLPTWMGDKGDALDLEKLAADAGVDYLNHSDINSESDLKWSYENSNKRILKTLTYDGKEINKAVINESFNVDVEFDRVFAISVGADNDQKYETPNSIKSFDSQYRYVAVSNADDLLNEIRNARENNYGFDLSWEYALHPNQTSTSGRRSFSSLSAVVSGNSESTFYIYPVWTLKAPVINKITGGNTHTYGDSFTLAGDVVSPIANLKLQYEWKNGRTHLSSDKEYTQSLARPDMSGTYSLTVTAGGDDVTSLTSSATYGNFVFTVNKKLLDVVWTIPDNEDRDSSSQIRFDYDATEKTISIAPNSDDIVASDDVKLHFEDETESYASSKNIRNAKTYSFKAALSNFSDLYTLTDIERTINIAPAPLELEWVGLKVGLESVIYDGRSHEVSASAEGLGDDGTLTAEISCSNSEGDFINASTYVLTATVNNDNYNVTNAIQNFVIEKCTLNVNWTETELTYDGTEQAPKASATGVETDGNIPLNVSGARKNANVNKTGDEASTKYTATASIQEEQHRGNYKLEDETHEFTIQRKEISIVWEETQSKKYNGETQSLLVESVEGEIEGEDEDEIIISKITYSALGTTHEETEIKNVDTYTVTATLDENGNYRLSDGQGTATLSIEQYEYDLSQEGDLISFGAASYVYNGEKQYRKVTLTAVGSGREELELKYTEESYQRNVGENYHVVVSFKNEIDKRNYQISNNSVEFSITQKDLVIKVKNVEKVYDGETYNSFGYDIDPQNGLAGEDRIESVVSISYEGDAITAKDVKEGGYTITAKLTASVEEDNNYNNYNVSQESGTLTINKRPITLVWGSNEDITYDGTHHNISVESLTDAYVSDESDVVSNESASIIGSLTYNGDGGKNVDDYSRTASLPKESNFELTAGCESVNFKIVPRDLMITIQGLEKTYSGQTFVGEFTHSETGIQEGDSLIAESIGTFAFTGEATTAKNVGNYTITGEVTVGDQTTYNNYKISINTGSLVIEKKEITLVWSEDTALVYSAEEQCLKVQSVTDEIEGEEQSILEAITYSGLKKDTNAKSGEEKYTVTASLPDESNYKIEQNSASNDYTIVPAEVSVSWTVDSFEYNGGEQLPAASATGVGDDGHLTLFVSANKTVRNVADDYEATATTEDKNYTLTNETHSFKITPKEVEVKWGNSTFTYNATEQIPEASVDGVNGEHVEVSVKVSDGKTAKDAGQYTVTASTDDKNYTLTDYTLTYDIEKASAQVEWQNTEFEYDGNDHQPAAEAHGVENESISLTVTVVGDGVAKEEGSYTAKAETDNSNYTLTNAETSFTITAKKVEVVWTETEFTYDGAEHKPTATVKGVNSESVGVTVEEMNGKTAKDADKYRFKASTTNHNYELLNAETDFTINVKKISVQWSWSVWSVEYDGEVQYPTATPTEGAIETVDKETVNVTVEVSGGAKKDKGEYSVTAKINSDNYTITDPTKKFEITAKAITVTWSDLSVEYNGKAQKPTATPAEGAIETVDKETVKVSVTVDGGTEDGATDVQEGGYKVTAKIDSENYTISNANETFTIYAKEITVEWGNTQLTYNGTPLKPEPTAEGVGNQSITLIVSVDENKDSVIVGSYKAIASTADTNYKLKNPEQEYQIIAKSITVEWGDTQLTYNGTDQTPEINATDGAIETVDQGQVNVTVNVTQGEMKDKGTYNVTAKIDSDNYTISNASQTFTINAKEITVDWSDLSVEYNGKAQEPTATPVEGAIVNGDQGTVNVSVTVEDGTEEGATDVKEDGYKVTATISSDNYTISNASQTFTINAKKLTVTWSDEPVKYSGEPVEYEATIDGVVEDDQVTFEYTYTADGEPVESLNKAGKYKAKIELSGDDAKNYEIDAKDLEHEFTVEDDSQPVNMHYTYHTAATKEEK